MRRLVRRPRLVPPQLPRPRVAPEPAPWLLVLLVLMCPPVGLLLLLRAWLRGDGR